MGFTVYGNLLEWQNWSLRVGFNYREEMTLHKVSYTDGGRRRPIAFCIHEEDNAVLWKHVDHHGGAEVRRMRRLVVSFHVTVANYEYLVYWRFYQDGNMECEVRATGIMVVTHLDAGQPHPHGTLVDTRAYAPFHQHFIVARLDLDIDGPANTVFRSETQIEPSPSGHCTPGSVTGPADHDGQQVHRHADRRTE